MKIAFSLLIYVCYSAIAWSSELTLGQTWNFAEKNALDEIHEHLQKNRLTIEKKAAAAKQKIEQNAKDYKAPNLIKLPRATKNEIFSPSMLYSLEFDVKDRMGNIVYPKGYTYNITDFVKLPYSIVVIDATDKIQLDWYLKSSYAKSLKAQVMTTDGNVTYVQSHIKNRPFFYFNKQLVDRFQVKATPSVITQEGKTIRVEQFALKGEK